MNGKLYKCAWFVSVCVCFLKRGTWWKISKVKCKIICREWMLSTLFSDKSSVTSKNTFDWYMVVVDLVGLASPGINILSMYLIIIHEMTTHENQKLWFPTCICFFCISIESQPWFECNGCKNVLTRGFWFFGFRFYQSNIFDRIIEKHSRAAAAAVVVSFFFHFDKFQ